MLCPMKKHCASVIVLAEASAVLALGCLLLASQDRKLGYDDTPILPDSTWHVHDGMRPQPRIVDAARVGTAPSDAIALFDGSDMDEWDKSWKVTDGYMEVNGKGSITSKRSFGDCQLHLEFATPGEVKGNSQGRGNSGIHFMGRFEVQILDSYENQTYPDGQCASLYGQCPPLVNVSRGPGVWQTYDIVFKAPRYEGKELTRPASVTVFHNGVCVHAEREFIGVTAHKAVAGYSGTDTKGPIGLQDHGNPMRFRNIWVRPLGEYDGGGPWEELPR
jgi:hypothetical protein